MFYRGKEKVRRAVSKRVALKESKSSEWQRFLISSERWFLGFSLAGILLGKEKIPLPPAGVAK